jgi:hypothetical protein
MTEDNQNKLSNKMGIIGTKMKTLWGMRMMGDKIEEKEGNKIKEQLQGWVDRVSANIDYLIANPQLKGQSKKKEKVSFSF